MRIVQWIALALAVFAAPMAQAQSAADYPTGPVRLLVPFAAGGPTDVVARILGELLSARWGGKTVLIENRPGAGTIVATAAVAKAPPDGLTLLVATNSLLINPAIAKSLPYDTAKDFAPVSMIAVQPVALVANKSFEGNTVADVVARGEEAADQLHLAGPARRGRSRRPDAQAARRHSGRELHPHQLQRQRAGADRCDRRPRAADVRHLAFGAALRRIRRAQADCERQRRAAAGRGERPDHRGNLSRRRSDRVQCDRGAGRHAGADPREAVGRHPRDRRVRRLQGQDQESRHQ